MAPTRTYRAGFNLIELLAVVLILAILAIVAVPLYLNTRSTSAARACKVNINAIASAESAYALRNNVYVDMATLLTSTEGLSATVVCPLDRSAYTIRHGSANGAAVNASGTQSKICIVCPNSATHKAALSGSAASDWQRTMASIGPDGGQ